MRVYMFLGLVRKWFGVVTKSTGSERGVGAVVDVGQTSPLFARQGLK